ncbi:hypothetical protein SAMN06265360_103191 [Haloechinothrix alba]|uniref:PE family protein n=1 Tax=Haloechinothrix alba TaxID=664784 RepID=A0A238VQM3_9PSEU|nr:hypothetical protein [Haloechinothrix alba]SNR36083.1 hypothetical protein SAMN06265360_103191 [Haloechinothrix alba]
MSDSEEDRSQGRPSGMDQAEVMENLPIDNPVRSAQEALWQMREAVAHAGVPDISFDRDGVDHVIGELEVIISERERSLSQADYLARIQPMGDEYASEWMVETANGAGKEYLAFAEAEIDSLRKFVEHLKQVRDEYLEHEEQVADDLNRGVQA